MHGREDSAVQRPGQSSLAHATRPRATSPSLAFITAQHTGNAGERGVLQPAGRGGEMAGVSAATVRRRLSIVSGFFAFLQARGDVPANPVPRILSPAAVDMLTAALRTHRDRAMVAAMVLGGLRRCEVLGQVNK